MISDCGVDFSLPLFLVRISAPYKVFSACSAEWLTYNFCLPIFAACFAVWLANTALGRCDFVILRKDFRLVRQELAHAHF